MAFQAMKKRYSDADVEFLKTVAAHSDKNPAFFFFLVEECRLLLSREECKVVPQVSRTCWELISQKINAELSNELRCSLESMVPEERLLLRRLVDDKHGISLKYLKNMSNGGWYNHLRGFLTVVSPTHVCVKSLPFESFITSTIDRGGSYKQTSQYGNRLCNILFNERLQRFGETCKMKWLRHAKVMPRITWFCSALPRRYRSRDDFLQSPLVQRILRFRNVVGRQQRAALENSRSLEEAVFEAFKCLRIILAHTKADEDVDFRPEFPVDVGLTVVHLSRKSNCVQRF